MTTAAVQMPITHKYTLGQFEDIICNGIDYQLPDEIRQKIQEIADQVGAPEYVRTPQFVRKDRGGRGRGNGGRRNRRKAQEVSDEDWEAIRTFEATQRETREGIDASIDLIRKALNKITDKTYDSLYPQIILEMDKVVEASSTVESGEEDMEKLSNRIFSIVSETAFYSDMYAKLYYELVEKYQWLRPVLDKTFEEYLSSTKTIVYCSPDEDYDAFCRNNKENTRRQAIGKFFVNISRHECLDPSAVADIIEEIQDYMMSIYKDEGKAEIVDELSEIVGGMIVAGHEDVLSNTDNWHSITQNVKEMSGLKARDFASLSNKAVFKHMDIMDVIS